MGQKTLEAAPITVNNPAADTVTNFTPQLEMSTSVQSRGSSSPRLELIYKMRSLEEESIDQCRAILRKVKLVLQRQRNTSNDIKDGVSELAEQFDVMERYRKSWKAAEEQRKESQLMAEPEMRSVTGPDTPLTSGKRIASSPADNTTGTGKKKRTKEPQKWQVVQKKSKKKSPPRNEEMTKERGQENTRQDRPRRTKPEAVLIKPSEGNSYADVLKNLRTKMQPNEAAKVRGIRKTRTGHLLLEFNKGEKIQNSFVMDLRSTVQQVGEVTELKPMETLEIRDLDSFTQKEEVEEAVRKQIAPDEVIRTRVTSPNSREQVRAFVTLSAEGAATLLKLGRIRIGWIQAKIRPWLSVKRCFRCLGVGHVRVDCKGPDRSDLCLKCGNPDHKISLYTGPSRCCLCVDAGREHVDHVSGSKVCPEFNVSMES